MRLTSSLAYTRAAPVPKMPTGLVELMEGLTKEVLKNNPSNVYEFCAQHFEKLLEIRDGPSPSESETLDEKIAKAQEIVRRRAKERQKRFEVEVQREQKNYVPNVVISEEHATEPEHVPDLRAPAYHDQELLLSSEVEVSHEPSDSLTSKDSNFDETEEVPISKSSTFSSVSRSTVIDLLAGNDHEINKEDLDDTIESIEIPKTDINESEHVKESDFVNNQKDTHIEIPKIEINNDEQVEESVDVENTVVNDPVNENIEIPKIEIKNDELFEESTISENEVVDDKKDELTVVTNTKPSFEVDRKIEDTIEALATQEDSSHKDHAKEHDNTFEVQLSEPVDSVDESKHEIELISLDNVNAIAEEDENMTIDVDPSNDLKTDFETDIRVEKVRMINEENQNEQVSTDDISEIKQGSDNTVESLNKSDQPEFLIDNANIVTNDSKPKPELTEIPNDSDGKKEIPTPKENDAKVLDLSTDVDVKQVSGHNDVEDSTNNLPDLNKIHGSNDEEEERSMMFSGDEEKVIEENVKSSSPSLQRSNSAENNEGSSTVGSDLSKVEDDTNRSDNENGENNMNLETAAETIQKVFRSFLFKSRNSTFEDITNDGATSLDEDNDKNKEEYYATAILNKERRPLGITRMDTVLQTVNEEKSLSLSTDDSSTLSSAATTIQAHVRGFLVRNRLNSYKTVSTNSLVNSNEMLDTDTEQQKNKTVLNIHIVPEEGNYLSRDESLITSMDLSLDESPPSSINLHPLSYDLVSERRKLLKREDAIQSVSPPSNNSGKLSEDSVKEILNENDASKTETNINEKDQPNPENSSPETLVTSTSLDTVIIQDSSNDPAESEKADERRKRSMSSDESDVVTPFVASPRSLVGDFENTSKLMHSGEFHDVVLPTKVSRSDTTVVREFKNVLAYILLWNNS